MRRTALQMFPKEIKREVGIFDPVDEKRVVQKAHGENP